MPVDSIFDFRAIGVTWATHLLDWRGSDCREGSGLCLFYKVCSRARKTTEQLLKKLKRGSLNSYRAMKEMV